MRAAPSASGLAMDEIRLVEDLRSQLATGVARSDGDPFAAGAVYDDFDAAAHTFGLLATARLYQDLTGQADYDAFATRQRDWVLGANPWGASLMIGVGHRLPALPAARGRQPVREPGRHGRRSSAARSSTARTAPTCSPTASTSSSRRARLPARWRRRLRGVHRPRRASTSTTSPPGRRSSPPSTSRRWRCWRSPSSSSRRPVGPDRHLCTGRSSRRADATNGAPTGQFVAPARVPGDARCARRATVARTRRDDRAMHAGGPSRTPTRLRPTLRRLSRLAARRFRWLTRRPRRA